MCSCAPGFVCSRCYGTRHDPAYFDPQNEEARPEEAPSESLARPSFACNPDESVSPEGFAWCVDFLAASGFAAWVLWILRVFA